MRRFVALLAVVLVACGSEATPEEVFCDRAVPILSREDMGPAAEGAVRDQMEELAEAAQVLPDDQQESVVTLIDETTEQVRLFEEGQSPDGWSSRDVVEHVGSLCDAQLTFWLVMP
jgi:hypothetical protein